jgi:hypothetical protein
MLMTSLLPSNCFSIWRAWRIWRLIGKVIGPTASILHATCIFVDFILHICVPSIAKMEAANKALAEERASRQVADQALQAAQESNSALI